MQILNIYYNLPRFKAFFVVIFPYAFFSYFDISTVKLSVVIAYSSVFLLNIPAIFPPIPEDFNYAYLYFVKTVYDNLIWKYEFSKQLIVFISKDYRLNIICNSIPTQYTINLSENVKKHKNLQNRISYLNLCSIFKLYQSFTSLIPTQHIKSFKFSFKSNILYIECNNYFPDPNTL